MMYMRFILCLGIGLFGLGIVLKMLIDLVFQDFDPILEAKHYVSDLSRRRRYVTLLSDEDEHAGRLSWQQARYQYSHQADSEPIVLPEKISVRT